MPNSLTWCDLPEDVSLWPGLPLSLSGDEVMPLDYHAGRSGWLLYGRGLDKRRLTAWQRELGAALVIVASWVVEDYQVIRLAGSLTPRATRLAHEAGLDVAPLGKIPHLRTPGLLVMDMDSTAIQIECIDEIAKLAGTGELVSEVTERAMRGELDFTASLRQAIALDPENITVHTLTLKRASNLVVEHRAAAYDDVSAMLESCRELADVGYRPYYMYRQKGTLQNLENIGWAKPGCECLYNIYIMEEIHTILSAGAGGSTKLVIPGQRRGKIERIFNFKYPTEYIDRFEEILARKQGVEDFYARYTTT